MSQPDTTGASSADYGDSETRLVRALLSMSKSTRALTGLKLAEMDFHNGQDELLLALDEEAPTTVSKLSDTLSVRPSTVSKMLDRLVTKGLVERSADLRDARRTMVHIMPAGLDARIQLLNVREKLDVELTSALPGNIEELIRSVDYVAANKKERLQRLR